MTIGSLIDTPSELTDSSSSKAAIVLMTRIRLARNLSGQPFPGWAKPAQREKILEACRAAVTATPVMKRGLAVTVGELGVLSLALAIGPNAALFSVIDHLLFKPYPIEGISRMYRFSTRTDSGYETPSYPDLLDYRAGTRDMADWIAADRELALLSLDGRREPTPISYVTENYFSVLGVRPAAGRILRESDDRFDGPPPVF